jgi:hypothetical protein
MRGKDMQTEHGQVISSILPVWAEALRDESGATFARVVAPHVRLEGSIFATPIDGREQVWTSLRTGGGITDTRPHPQQYRADRQRGASPPAPRRRPRLLG